VACYQNTSRTVRHLSFQPLLLEPDILLGHYLSVSLFKSPTRSVPNIKITDAFSRHPHSLSAGSLFVGSRRNGRSLLRIEESRGSYRKIMMPLRFGKTLLLEGMPNRRPSAHLRLKPADPGRIPLARASEKMGLKEEAQQEFQTFAALKNTQPVTEEWQPGHRDAQSFNPCGLNFSCLWLCDSILCLAASALPQAAHNLISRNHDSSFAPARSPA